MASCGYTFCGSFLRPELGGGGLAAPGPRGHQDGSWLIVILLLLSSKIRYASWGPSDVPTETPLRLQAWGVKKSHCLTSRKSVFPQEPKTRERTTQRRHFQFNSLACPAVANASSPNTRSHHRPLALVPDLSPSEPNTMRYALQKWRTPSRKD